MKYAVVIIDGAAGLPLPERGGKTCLELARTPNLDSMVQEGALGLARTVPLGMEPTSANACMSVLGYDPRAYYQGRAAIEARSMGITVAEGEVVFRCNLVAIRDGKMWDYSAGHISADEAQALIAALEERLGSDQVHFYSGVSYRHICKISGRGDALLATCTPPHDIPDKPIASFLPHGQGSDLLRGLMNRSEDILRDHPVNVERKARGETPATMIWLFWGSGQASDIPAFEELYGLTASVTSAVDVLQGLARMMGMGVLDIPGVTDGLDNDYAAQAAGALASLESRDLVIVHVEATDEAAHAGSVDEKVEAIQKVDKEILGQLLSWRADALRLLVMPDHPTPIKTQTHSGDPVPFLMWGPGVGSNGAKRFTETEAQKTGLFINPAYNIMSRFIAKLGEAEG